MIAMYYYRVHKVLRTKVDTSAFTRRGIERMITQIGVNSWRQLYAASWTMLLMMMMMTILIYYFGHDVYDVSSLHVWHHVYAVGLRAAAIK